jgi:hypothetical protein
MLVLIDISQTINCMGRSRSPFLFFKDIYQSPFKLWVSVAILRLVSRLFLSTYFGALTRSVQFVFRRMICRYVSCGLMRGNIPTIRFLRSTICSHIVTKIRRKPNLASSSLNLCCQKRWTSPVTKKVQFYSELHCHTKLEAIPIRGCLTWHQAY